MEVRAIGGMRQYFPSNFHSPFSRVTTDMQKKYMHHRSQWAGLLNMCFKFFEGIYILDRIYCPSMLQKCFCIPKTASITFPALSSICSYMKLFHWLLLSFRFKKLTQVLYSVTFSQKLITLQIETLHVFGSNCFSPIYSHQIINWKQTHNLWYHIIGWEPTVEIYNVIFS